MKKKAAYTIRRHGKNYRVRDLVTIRQWIDEGRVVGSDLIYAENDGKWHRLREWPFLKDEFESSTDKPRPPLIPPTVYWLHRDGESFAADGLDTLIKWARAGKIGPDDYVMHPALGSWFKASESAALLAVMPEGVRQGVVAVLPIVLDPFAAVPDEEVVAHVTTQPDFARTPETLGVASTQTIGTIEVSGLGPAPVTGDPDSESEPAIAESAVNTTQDMGSLAPQDFTDDFGVFYDCARLFMVARDLRPDESIEGACPHPLTGDDLSGASKLEVFLAIRKAVQSGIATASDALRKAGEHLLETLQDCDGLIGKKPPERLVIGNQGRAKMTSEEQQLMQRVETALRGIISLNEPTNG